MSTMSDGGVGKGDMAERREAVAAAASAFRSVLLKQCTNLEIIETSEVRSVVSGDGTIAVPLGEWSRGAIRWRDDVTNSDGGVDSSLERRRAWLFQVVEMSRRTAARAAQSRISLRIEDFVVVMEDTETPCVGADQSIRYGEGTEEEKKDRSLITGDVGDARERPSLATIDVALAQKPPVKYSVGGESTSDAAAKLAALGSILFELFSGQPFLQPGHDHDAGHGGDDSRSRRNKRLSAGDASPRDALVSLGLPSNLCDVISSAIDPSTGECRYELSDQVEEDLNLMISKPNIYLSDKDAFDTSMCDGNLNFPPAEECLYGREAQLAALMSAYERATANRLTHTRKLSPSSEDQVSDGEHAGPGTPAPRPRRLGTPEIVLLSGHLGSGKSALASRARRLFSERGARFAYGKFDEIRRPEPLSGIASAFGDCCIKILEDGSEEEIKDAREAIHEALGVESRVLIDTIPALSGLVGEADLSSCSDARGKAARNRIRFLFRKFVRAVATRRRPLVLFLDDLHWADDESLELVAFLATDPQRPPFLLIGSCRSADMSTADVGGASPPGRRLHDIVKNGASIVGVPVGSIDAESCCAAIAETLLVLPRIVGPLSEEVRRKTSGNPLFLRQFLRSLVDEGMLHFSLRTRRWEWDLDSIRSKDAEEDVLALLMVKILTMSAPVQHALRLASCFGSQCSESTLRLLEEGIEGGVCRGVIVCLDAAAKEGLVVKVPAGNSGCHLSAGAEFAYYKFSHDQIRNAAYSLIPKEERAALHLELGRFLVAASASDQVTEDAKIALDSVVVDQMNHGSALIVDEKERVGLAALNLRVGKKLEAASSFSAASSYLRQGIKLLSEGVALGVGDSEDGVDEEGDWASQYGLTLELFQSCAEVLFVAGDFDSANSLLLAIFEHAKCFPDKVRAYHSLINLLGAQNRIVDAITTGFSVLSTLGESFPQDVNREVVQSDLLLTMDALEGTTFDAILAQDEMPPRSEKRIVMRFLGQVMRYTYVADQDMFALLCFRLVRLTLAHGVCEESCGAFASLGIILNRVAGNPKNAYKFGKLALSLTKRLNARRPLPNVYTLVYGLLNIFFEPLQAVTDKLLEGYEIGLLTGDVDSAMSSLNFRFGSCLPNGYNLDVLVDEMKVAVVTMKQVGQRFQLFFTSLLLQCTLNLMGFAKGDPTVLTGELINEEQAMTIGRKQQNVTIQLIMYLYKMWLAYYFRNYRLAGELAIARRNLTNERPGMLRSSGIVHETLYTGLIAAEIARTGNSNEWRQVICESISSLEGWAELCSWNFQHKLLLLTAELARLDGEDERAAKTYDEAIATAKSHRFVHEQALACERAAMFSLELGNRITAKDYFTQAHELYIEWGARAKAADVLDQMSTM